jgi:hypothetical protein
MHIQYQSFYKTPPMSEKELNAYRLTSMEEPTDEMLSAIMKEAAEEATASTNKALADYFAEISAMMQRKIVML